jgi:hypothetical protein
MLALITVLVFTILYCLQNDLEVIFRDRLTFPEGRLENLEKMPDVSPTSDRATQSGG